MASNATTRSLLEVALGFLGALLVVPLLFKTVGLAFRAVIAVVAGVFKFSTTRRLVGDLLIGGLTAYLAKENNVLDAVFGKKGKTGDGLLKPPVDR